MARAATPPLDSSPNGAASHGLVLVGDRAEDVVAFEEQVVAFFVDAAEMLGVPKSVAAIYGLVFASPEPLSFAEIEARLDISKGSVSQGLRVLREMGALKEVSENSDRAERFMPDLELRKLVSRFIESRLEKQLTTGNSKLMALSKAVPGRNGQAAELKKRVQALTDWNTKARTLLPLVRTVLKIGN